MSISLVGTATAENAGIGASLSVTLPGGVAENDVVLVSWAKSNTSNLTLDEAGGTYAEIAELYSNDGSDVNFAAYIKVQGSTPDSSVSMTSSSSTSSDKRINARVYRGVDTTTPQDATATSSTFIDTGQPNPPAITPVTDGAVVVSMAASSSQVTVSNVPTGYGNLATTSSSVDGCASADKTVSTAGSEDPGAWTDWGSGSTLSACAITIALRPGSSAPFTGTLSKTLDALTLSSAATSPFAGFVTKTLQALTTASAGSLLAAGSLSKTLDAATLTSAGTITGGLTGTLGKTLQALTTVSSGALVISGVLTKTLGSLGVSASGTMAGTPPEEFGTVTILGGPRRRREKTTRERQRELHDAVRTSIEPKRPKTVERQIVARAEEIIEGTPSLADAVVRFMPAPRPVVPVEARLPAPAKVPVLRLPSYEEDDEEVLVIGAAAAFG